MKKVLAVVLAAALCLTFCACGSLVKELKDSAEKAVEAAAPAAPKETGTETKPIAAERGETTDIRPAEDETAPKTKPIAKAEAAPLAQTRTTSETPSMTVESVTPAISAARYAYAPVRVTKSPTGETVYEGGSASFVAYAENSTGISWLIVNPNGRDFVEASALAKAMPGLAISGTASTTLTIGCIPLSFDGWYIQAKFYGEGGPVHSSMARLTVWPYPAKGSACGSWSCGGNGAAWGGSCDPWTYEKSCDPWTYEKSCGGCCCDPWSCGACPW